MITLKYYKRGKAIYLSHIDVLRHLNRTFRRAGIEVNFSQGFNPHMLTKLGVPLPLATYSSAEYVTVSCDLEPEEFLEKYNAVCMEGMEGIKAFKIQRNPNLAGKVVFADYTIGAKVGDKAEEINNVPKLNSFVVDYPTRKEPDKKKDIAGAVKAVKCNSENIEVCIDAVSMRADVLAVSLARAFSIETDTNNIWRTAQYVKGADGKLVDVDDYLKEC